MVFKFGVNTEVKQSNKFKKLRKKRSELLVSKIDSKLQTPYSKN